MNLRPIQVRLYQILESEVKQDLAAKLCTILVSTVVLLNIVAVVLESVNTLYQQWRIYFELFELFSIILFSIEYLLRIWANGASLPSGQGNSWRGRKAYILSFYGLIDLVALAPYFLQMLMPGLDLRVIRAVRLLRVFKISHYSTAIEDLVQAIYEERRSFAATLYLLLITVLITSSLMYYAEHEAQPEIFASIPDAIYWAIITLTTVGYGDFTPVTWFGRVISLFTAFLGVCTVAILTGIVASAFANQMARRRVIFETELRKAFVDGVISPQEDQILDQLGRAFNLSTEEKEKMMDKVRQELSKRET
ncbi:putative Potassium voltage-gated channel subfamily KQT; potassium channel, VIC family [Candidatus Nitrotoga sp. BS]|uniref:ion transporter n=1 Tax=Candidatus Nitrotoga sp. BS TaxID=2890408 RepID=UPI001EF269D9|nr:ion transporter [Candidatus Nitrotoga sp. BS]CAH1198633.1 putative Potassium voltage-gated channel subfamily KQT; potassium channel, VIC family [Candidatus Nitrotoga sp. BS]